MTDIQLKPGAGRVLLMTLVAAVAAVLVNNVYSIAYTAATGFSIPEVINPVSVSMFSAAPVILGGIIYLIASRFSVKVANWGLVIGTVAMFVMLTIPTFGEMIQTPTLAEPIPAPDGFVGLSLGLHFAGPVFLLWLVPSWKN